MKAVFKELSVFAAVTLPPLGLGLFALLRFMRPWAASRAWLALWGGVFLFGLLHALLIGEVRAGFIPQALLGLVASLLLHAPRAALVRGLLAALVVFASASLLERWSTALLWNPEGESRTLVEGVAALLTPTQRLEGAHNRRWARAPGAPGGEGLSLSFEARRRSGLTGWDWHRSDPNFVLEPQVEDGEVFTRIVTPVGPDPYLMRTVHTGGAVGGRVFRVTLELRAPQPLPAEGCRGVWLMTWEPQAAAQCFPVALGTDWQAFSFDWAAADHAQSPVLRVILNDFDGLGYEVRRVRLYDITADPDDNLALHERLLGPLSPEGAHLELGWTGRDPQVKPNLDFLPEEAWQSYSLELRDEALEWSPLLEARLVLGDGLEIEMRELALAPPGGPPLQPAPMPLRLRLWFDHPNLAGHSAAAIGLSLLSTAPSTLVGLAAAGLTLLTAFFSSSRGAWFSLLLGIPLLLYFCGPGKARLRVSVALAGATAALLLLGTDGLGRLQVAGVAETTRRPEIWAVAWQALLEHPWTGLAPGTFSDYWLIRYEGASPEVVQHAHNFWLSLAAAYGLPGLAAALWLSGGLLVLAWRWGRWRGFAFLAPFFVMNIVDATLLSSGVLFPLLLGLNALRLALPQPLARSVS